MRRAAAALATMSLLVLAPAAAHAGVPRTPFTVTPASASTSSPITATWKVDRRLKRGETFGFELTITPNDGHGGAGAGYDCATQARVAPRVVRKGGVLRAVFRPGAGLPRDLTPPWKTWCPGTAGIVLFRYLAPPGPGWSPAERFLGKRSISIALKPGETLPYTATGVQVTVLPGSTITASAPGRPDRTTPVSGAMRGAIRGPFTPNRDFVAEGFVGAVQLPSFAPDPLCPGTAPPASADVVGGSSLDVRAKGEVRFSLSVAGSASQVFGCGPAGALAGATTFPLSGTVGPKGLAEQSLGGAVPGILLPDGTQGGLAAKLLVSIDLTGRR